MSTHDQVLSDFIDAWNTGRRPRLREYLTRLPDGPEREALADQITTWLEVAPTPSYDNPTRARIAREPAVEHLLSTAASESGLWPALLPRLRRRRGLTVGQLAAELVQRLSLTREDTDRAAAYLQRLEDGHLDPARVSHRLLDALGALLGVPGRALAESAGFGRGFRASPALFRSEAPPPPASAAGGWIGHDIEILSRAAAAPAPPPMDELDRLFTGGPDA